VEPPLLLQGVVLNDADASKDTEKDTGALDGISPARYSIPFSAAPDPETIVGSTRLLVRGSTEEVETY
jgi:hypothetical protein